jgi:DNA topoisomerase-3
MSFDTLVIAEKPSAANDLVAGLGVKILNTKTRVSDGYTDLSNGMRVMPLFGHMIVALPPNAYLTEEQQRGNQFDVIPFLPYPLKVQPKPERDPKTGKPKMRDGKPVESAHFKTLVKMIGEAKVIINAGDIDREGQLIVDELLEYCGVDPTGQTKPIKRVAIMSNHPDDVKDAFAKIESNGAPRWLYKRHAAIARQYLDYWLGMSISMAYQQITGYRQTSAGRVQTPVAWLVTERDRQIESFRAVKYYVPHVKLTDGTVMRWYQRENAAVTPGFDERGRIIDRRIGEAIVAAIRGGMGANVTMADQTHMKEGPPLPFSIGELQVTCGRRFGMSVKEVADVAQGLYEKRKMITYVGTDIRFLPEAKHAEAPGVLQQLGQLNGNLIAGATPSRRSRAWNDSKVEEHFGIMPTGRVESGLSQAEAQIFETIMRRYVAQFYPDFEFVKTSLGVMFGADEFRASSRQTLVRGWKEAEGLPVEDEQEEDALADAEAEREAEATRPSAPGGRG